MGGIYSARAASVERRIKAVVSDSLTFDVHAEMQRRLRQPDASMWTHLKWVYGCGTPEEVVEKSRDFRMADFIGKIECPYLIVQGEHDFLGLQTAVDAFHFAKARGVPVELKVFDAEETGASHCQADNPALGQEFICDWIAEKLDIKQSISGL
jgi:pimeloyl-ACP methyl ester carboxylesterase